MTFVFFFLALLYFSRLFLGNRVKKRRMWNLSGYVGKVFTTKIPLMYRKNSPNVNDVSNYIADNTFAVLSRKTSTELVEFSNNCLNCLSPDRLVTPLRIQLVPAGTRFEVVEEYRYFRAGFLWPLLPATDIPMLLIKDQEETLSEIPVYSFEPIVIQGDRNGSLDEEKIILPALKNLEENGFLEVTFCEKDTSASYFDDPGFVALGRTYGYKAINDFVRDFQFSTDILVEPAEPSSAGKRLTFRTAEAYLTAIHYFSAWNIYGSWTYPTFD